MVETRRLQVSSTCAASPLRDLELRQPSLGLRRLRVVALQVAFERETLKPVFHLMGVRLWV
jgi:hypothetical protein